VQFGGVRPLDALDAELAAPIVGLIGPNGAGKTTFLNVVSGFVRPLSGEIVINGVNLAKLSSRRRVALGLRRMFQQEQIVDDLTLRENVLAVADHVASSRREGKREIDRAIHYVGLDDRAHVAGRALNLLERRLAEVARTLVGRPAVILMDEPAAGLNESETERLRQVLVGIPGAFAAQVVLIDHDAGLIATACEETLVLDFGKRLALGPTRTVLDDPVVRRAYLGTE
jgi:branched-chain amino acid transport system ATP-binding protein